MPRRKLRKQKDQIFDPVFNSSVVAKMVNSIMLHGKKATAEKVVYGAMNEIQEKLQEDPLKVVTKAVENIRPQIETRSRRVGGATYQVPMEVRKDRSYALAIRWLTQYARERGGKSMQEKLVGELLDAFNNRGGAIKKRETVHKMAESNRAFAHYRW
ncbi:MAG TPA: 30S ribosomal protein S7 [Candidatus Aminicenantes bacterium]|nr:30S ribosomal protein S7 [Candidatus Aminicenantes bacterium]